MAQATHGSAPDIAGKGIANPYAMMESTRMLFDWLGRANMQPAAIQMSEILLTALTAALSRPETRTGDIRGTGSPLAMESAVLRALDP
jgi:3-isopropylmalate dehydrogenase